MFACEFYGKGTWAFMGARSGGVCFSDFVVDGCGWFVLVETNCQGLWLSAGPWSRSRAGTEPISEVFFGTCVPCSRCTSTL